MINDKLLEACRPPQVLREGHLQTLLGHFLPSPNLNIKLHSVKMTLKDGEKLALKIGQGSSPLVILLFHGLTGSTNSNYMQRAAQELSFKGHTVVLVNHRGCGDGRGLAGQPYHSGKGEDVSDVVAWARENFKDKKIIAVGYSLGANALLNLLTGLRGETLPNGAIAVNGPIDLKACSEALKKGLNRIYDLYFVYACKKEIADRVRLGLVDSSLLRSPELDTVFTWRHYLHDIDRLYTAPASGFLSAEDYYEKCSTAEHLHKISVPTVLLTSKSDPFVPWSTYAKVKLSSKVHLRLEEFGGHLGYLEGFRSRWLERALCFYIDRLQELI